jgi:hypothetical protein
MPNPDAVIRSSPHGKVLRDLVAKHLISELGNTKLATELAAILFDEVLTYRAPEHSLTGVSLILAFTFGSRVLPNGNRIPGPVNEELAGVARELYAQTGAPIVAQWEVAEAIGTTAPVTAIYPRRDARGEALYLGTQATVAEMFRLAPASEPVLVVAFADHMRRAVMSARAVGFDAYAPANVALPSEYDAQSSQAWCRSRIGYLLHDLMLRLADRRAVVVGAPW